MNEAKDIIELTKRVASNTYRLDDLVDEATAPIKDYTTTASGFAAPIRTFASLQSVANKMKFRRFLMSYAAKVNANQEAVQDLFRLESFLTNTKNLELIAATIDAALNAKAMRCSSILGYFAGDIIASKRNVEYKDFIIVNALEHLLEDDLANFVNLYEYCTHENRYDGYRTCDMPEELSGLGAPLFQLELTIEKLKSVLVIGFGVGGFENVGNAWGAFRFNENSDYFYALVKQCGI